MNMTDTILEVNEVYKKFCLNLRLNMVYGIQDVFSKKNKKTIPSLRKQEFWALQDVNLKIKRGEVVGIIGMNGAGKTTLIRTIMGSFPVSYGNIQINGRITTAFERNTAFQPFYSGEENVRVKCTLFGMDEKEIDKRLPDIIDFAEINKFKDAPFGSFSSGMKARINFSIALCANPDLLIVDEGLAVSDVHFREKCMTTIDGMKNKMATILISHDIEQYQKLATRLIIMDKGRIIGETTDIENGIKEALIKR